MPNMKFTKRSIEALVAPDPSGGPEFYWSETAETGPSMSGLGIMVSGVTTTKSWVCQGNSQWQGAAHHARAVGVLSIEEAWERPAQARGHAPGQRPQAHRAAAPDGGDDRGRGPGRLPHRQSNLRPSTVSIYRSAAKHLGPLLNRSLREITAEMIENSSGTSSGTWSPAARRVRSLAASTSTGGRPPTSPCGCLGRSGISNAERDTGLADNPVKDKRFQGQWHDIGAGPASFPRSSWPTSIRRP